MKSITPDLTILHTNDLHGKLTDRAVEIISQDKKSSAPCLLLDSGDAVSSGNIYYRPGGEPILSRMSDIGYDAMAMGNREFHFLECGLISKVKLARFPILSANMRFNNNEAEQMIHPSIIPDIGGYKVAVFGLTVAMITKKMLVSRLSPFWFQNPLQAAEEVVPKLKNKADLVIALTHIGMKLDRELARTVPGIDIIIGGHSHEATHTRVWEGDTLIVQAGCWGRYLGKVKINLSAPGGRPDIHEELIDLRA